MQMINRDKRNQSLIKPIILSFLLIVLLILIFFNLSYAAGKKPDWVKKRPLNKFYFIGISMANKSRFNQDYIHQTKEKALNDLASEITVTISGESIIRLVEQYNMVAEEVKSEIRASTKANLAGYELVDTWEDKNEYWVYYRLSKDLYYQQKQAKLQRAISLSLDMFKKAKNNEREMNISQALAYYLQALTPIQSYIDEPLKTDYEGSNIYLLNEIYTSIQSLLNRIEFTANPEKQEAKIGQPLKNPLMVSVTCLNESSGEAVPVSRLPVTFTFIRGSGEMVEKAQSNETGRARCRVAKITATDKIQIVKAELDLSSLMSQDSFPFVFKTSLSSFTLPSTRFLLNVSGLTVCVNAEEKNIGQGLDVHVIEPAIKNSLTDYGFTFTDDMSSADILIDLKAESRRGSEMYGMYSAFVNFTISVVDMTSGKEVYKSGLQDIKGIQLGYEKAGLKAFENAANELKTKILPELIDQIQK